MLFEAAKPTFRLKKSIKRLAGAKIITNKIRAPINSNLTLSSSRSMTFHGSDDNIFEANAIKIYANRSVIFKASGQGSIKLIGRGRNGITLPRASSLPISESPAFSADRLGLRLCVCKNTGRLFAVQGKDKCRIQEAYCH